MKIMSQVEFVYIVFFSYPHEDQTIESIWSNETSAEIECRKLNNDHNKTEEERWANVSKRNRYFSQKVLDPYFVERVELKHEREET